MFDLITTKTKDNLILSGLITNENKKNPLVIFIHGHTGNFYRHSFIQPIAEKLQSKKINILLPETRGDNNNFNIYDKDGINQNHGGIQETLTETHIDIDAWISKAKELEYSDIILLGHSLGAMKVLRYEFEGKYKNNIKKIFAISPFDMNILLNKNANEFEKRLKLSKEKIKKGKGNEHIPAKFKTIGEFSYKKFEELCQKTPKNSVFNFSDQKNNYSLLKKITKKVHFILGSSDPLVKDKKELQSILCTHTQNATFDLIKDAGHTFTGYEKKLADKIIELL